MKTRKKGFFKEMKIFEMELTTIIYWVNVISICIWTKELHNVL